MAPESLTEFVPLQYDTKGEKKIITQYDMYSVGEDGVGLLKFDFLGIKNLSILADAVERVKKVENITSISKMFRLMIKKRLIFLPEAKRPVFSSSTAPA
jgi:DNA polymerase-3 subunit alpha